MLDQLWTWLMTSLQPYGPRPYSTILIATVALILSLTTNIANRLLVDVERMRSVMEEVKAWRREYEIAKKTNNKQLMAKVMKRQKAIMQLQGKASWDRMKVSLMYIGPFWIIFYILSSFFKDSTVALSPFTFPYLLGEDLPFITWYIICSLAMSLPMSRLLGANPEMG